MNPRWEVPPEPWILRWGNLGVVFAFTVPSLQEGPALPGSVFGGSMAIRTRIFAAGYRFNTAMGPRRDSYAMGEDIDLLTRLDQAGFRSWYCRKAVAEHLVPKSRMTRAWIISKAVRFGRGQYRLRVQRGQANPKTLSGFIKEIARILKQVVKRGLEAGWARLFGGEARTTRKYWDLNYWIGQLIEVWLVHKEP